MDNLVEAKNILIKQFGDGAVFTLGDKPVALVPAYRTGSLVLDRAMGIGGWPVGRIVEIYGNESSGKTTIGLRTMAELQKVGGTGAIIDVEHALDPEWAIKNGVDINNLLISQPDSGEEALDVLESMILTKKIDIIVIDSVAALVPQAELDGDFSDNVIGLQARLMSKAMRKLKGIANENDCTLIFINQIREKVGVIYGSNETTSGGRALRFFSSVRVDVRRGQLLKEGDVNIGHQVNCRIIKNKVAAPYKVASFDIRYDIGLDTTKEIAVMADISGIVEKKGSWYTYGDYKWQGLNNMRQALAEDIALYNKIISEIEQTL